MIPRGPACGSVLAYTTSTSASGPLVIHILVPFRMNRSFRWSARVAMETTSDPAPGSLIASAPTWLAAHQLRQISLLLLGAPVAMDLVHAEVGMRAIGQPDRSRRPADLLHRHHMLQIPHRRPAILLPDGNPEHPELPELRPQGRGEQVVPIDGGRLRRNLRSRKGPHLITQHVGGLAEVEIESGRHGWVSRRAGSRFTLWTE